MGGGISDALDGGVVEVLVDVVVTHYVQLEARLHAVPAEVVGAKLIDDVAVLYSSAPVHPNYLWEVLPRP